MMSTAHSPSVTVLGAGNAGRALAGDMGRLGLR